MSVADKIKEKLEAKLSPAELVIVNESDHHAGHSGDNGTGESHFRVTIVSDEFADLNRVERQRLVYDILSAELQGSVHALSLKCHTPQEKQK